MSQLVERGVALGLSLVWEMDRRALQRGTSRSRELVRYIDGALSAKRLLDVREDRYLDDSSLGLGRATIWADAEIWMHVDACATRLGVSVSEAVRMLVHAGLALAAPEPDVASTVDLRARALSFLVEPRSTTELARHMWPAVEASSVLRGCVRRFLLELYCEELVDFQPRGWKKPTSWSVKVPRSPSA